MTIGVFSIVLDDEQKVLLCHRRDKDLWNLPGGRVEKGESPWQAAIREAKEEIGFDIVIIRLVGVYYKPLVDDLVFMFLARIKDNFRPTTSDEVDKIAFYSDDELPANTAPKQRCRLLSLLANDKLMDTEVVLQEQ